MRHLTRCHGTVLGATLLLAALTLTMATAPAGASLLPAAGTPSVPIMGQVALKENIETGKSAGVGTLHGVRRIPGGTVIYYSLGFPASAKGSSSIMFLDGHSTGFTRANRLSVLAKNNLVDPAGKKVYSPLILSGSKPSGENCICTGNNNVLYYKSGEARVLSQVVAALPDSVQFVDVLLAGQMIGHVKVDNGPMAPEVDPSKIILVGTGWPKIDQAAVASSVDPARSVMDLETSVADPEKTVTTQVTPKQVSVVLASDVLFGTDSATLSPKAQAVLGRAAAEVKAAGGTGTLQVVGYTDDTGSTDHNVDLSRRRAAAVAAAIKPLLGAGIQLQTSGKGEADPVAPNKTSAGKTLNRRVSVVFAPQGGTK